MDKGAFTVDKVRFHNRTINSCMLWLYQYADVQQGRFESHMAVIIESDALLDNSCWHLEPLEAYLGDYVLHFDNLSGT